MSTCHGKLDLGDGCFLLLENGGGFMLLEQHDPMACRVAYLPDVDGDTILFGTLTDTELNGYINNTEIE